MSALTIGITNARDPACKRGLAVNLAASRARSTAGSSHVCVVDADPFSRDVTTRLAVTGRAAEDVGGDPQVSVRGLDPRLDTLDTVHDPPLWVLPNVAGVGPGDRTLGELLRKLRARFDVVVCDLAGGPGPDREMSGRFDELDWLLVAVTPRIEPVEATARFLAQFEAARDCGDVCGSVRVGLVTTGDEASTELSSDEVARMLDAPVLASVRQLWGRAVPNVGFGAALGIGELDESVAALFERLAGSAELAISRAP
ncbi:MAG: hypothetical protein ACLPVY_01360 [Acidimicrobiia bacterium]